MDRTPIADPSILDGSGGAPFPGDVLVEGRSEGLGQIKPGYLAGLLLVDGDPLAARTLCSRS